MSQTPSFSSSVIRQTYWRKYGIFSESHFGIFHSLAVFQNCRQKPQVKGKSTLSNDCYEWIVQKFRSSWCVAESCSSLQLVAAGTLLLPSAVALHHASVCMDHNCFYCNTSACTHTFQAWLKHCRCRQSHTHRPEHQHHHVLKWVILISATFCWETPDPGFHLPKHPCRPGTLRLWSPSWTLHVDSTFIDHSATAWGTCLRA